MKFAIFEKLNYIHQMRYQNGKSICYSFNIIVRKKDVIKI